MLTRKTLFAIAATAALGLSALGTTEASAWGHHGFRSHFHFGHHFRSHWASHRFGYRWSYHRSYRWHYRSNWYRPHVWHYRWYGNYRPYSYGAVGGSVRQPVQQAAQAPGNCLAKQYLPNGSVMFQDLCTEETAVARPGSY